jgi:hypothetical protein
LPQILQRLSLTNLAIKNFVVNQLDSAESYEVNWLNKSLTMNSDAGQVLGKVIAK